jgi:hypothetical protein
MAEGCAIGGAQKIILFFDGSLTRSLFRGIRKALPPNLEAVAQYRRNLRMYW